MSNYKPSKNTLGVKKGEAKSEAPDNVKNFWINRRLQRLISDVGQGQTYW